jgi:hypothetical protein
MADAIPPSNDPSSGEPSGDPPGPGEKAPLKLSELRRRYPELEDLEVVWVVPPESFLSQCAKHTLFHVLGAGAVALIAFTAGVLLW